MCCSKHPTFEYGSCYGPILRPRNPNKGFMISGPTVNRSMPEDLIHDSSSIANDESVEGSGCGQFLRHSTFKFLGSMRHKHLLTGRNKCCKAAMEIERSRTLRSKMQTSGRKRSLRYCSKIFSERHGVKYEN